MQICRGEVEKAVGPMLKYAYALSGASLSPMAVLDPA